MIGKTKEGVLSTATIIGFAPSTDPKKSRAFYEGILGLKFIADDGFAQVFDANGIMIRIAKTENFTAAPYTILGWNVSNIVETMNDLMAKGVVFERYAFLQQDSLGWWQSPNGAKVAWFKDPDANLLSLTEFE